jgi:DNA-binding beta-propeller fold protein YncE
MRPVGIAAGVAAIAVIAAAVAGCSASAPAKPTPSSTTRAASGPPAPSPVTLAGHGSVSASLPGCATATQAAPSLPGSLVSLTHLSSNPFGVAVMPGNEWGFTTLGASIGVVRLGASGPPRLAQAISTAAGLGSARGSGPGLSSPAGAVLTPGGKYLLAVNGQGGVQVISTAAAERGSSRAILGNITVPASAGQRSGQGDIEVAVTPDGRYAFVSEEVSDQIAVFNLRYALAGHFGAASYIGMIPMQLAPVGMAVSPDGRWLYATSEVIRPPRMVGSLSVISVTRAETDPAAAVVTRVPAGCNPVRVVTSANGQVVWVTARASDALLAFSASRLVARTPRPLLATIRVGELPVGLALARAGQLILVADSDRFDVPGTHASLAVVDVADMLAGRPALLGYLPAGRFPRDIAAGPGGSVLLVANYVSDQLEAVRLDGLP